jgi:hypothetical protein
MTETSHSIKGSWSGAFFYSSQSQHGSSFEAVFIDMSGQIDGNILDQIGEATVTGTFVYPALQFTKIYRTPSEPVTYIGTMSEDGGTLNGTWSISNSKLHGTWHATRTDDAEDLKFEGFRETERELVRVRPRTRTVQQSKKLSR